MGEWGELDFKLRLYHFPPLWPKQFISFSKPQLLYLQSGNTNVHLQGLWGIESGNDIEHSEQHWVFSKSSRKDSCHRYHHYHFYYHYESTKHWYSFLILALCTEPESPLSSLWVAFKVLVFSSWCCPHTVITFYITPVTILRSSLNLY